MAKEKTKPEKNQVKVSEKKKVSSKLNAQVFSMPNKYRHGKEPAVVEPKKKQVVKQVIQPTKPPKPAPTQTGKPPAKKSKTKKSLIIAGVVMIFAVSLSSYLLLRSKQKQPSPTNDVKVVKTEPVVKEKPTPKPVEKEVPKDDSKSASPFVKQITPGKDSDSDGLTDVEEQLIYNTNPSLPDSDKDGFLDGNEVYHKYNPAGTAPVTLLGSKLVLQKNTDNFSILYPSKWTAGDSTKDVNTNFPKSILFNVPSGEQIRVMISNGSTPVDTLMQEWKNSLDNKIVLETDSKVGFKLYVSSDKLRSFLVLNGTAITFKYETGNKTAVDYLQTYQMMINSIQKINPPKESVDGSEEE